MFTVPCLYAKKNKKNQKKTTTLMQSLWHRPMQIHESLKLLSTILSFHFVLNPHIATVRCVGEARDELRLEALFHYNV